MLEANCGLSRKLTRDFNSAGYSINLESEVAGNLDHPQAVLDRIKELYALAEEALLQQIARDQGDEAIASRDVDGGGRGDKTSDNPVRRRDPSPGTSDHGTTPAGAATPKQLAFVRTLAKRQTLSPAELERVIGETLGHRTAVDELTKSEAAKVIDVLNQSRTGDGRSDR